MGIYRASDDKMLAYQTNRYFAEDSSNIELIDYENGTCYTDNFCTYNIDLSNYIGEELYIRIVDNDTGYYYGYLSVDDIRIGKSAEAQQEGAYFTKTVKREEARQDSVYEIANGSFETGNLSGWEVKEGLAFSDDGVNCDPYWWAEQIPYEREGNFHYGYYNPTATGRMKSSTFIVGGTGYVTYKLGGCSNNDTAYLRFMKANAEGEDTEILRVSNYAFKDMQFPFVPNGMRVINMNQYRLDLSPYMNERLYIEVVDENSSSDMAGCVVLDSVKTYYTEKPEYTDCFDVEYKVEEIIPDSEYQIINGGFETGDLTGWTKDGDLGDVSADKTWRAEKLPFNKKGKYHFSGMSNEAGRGTLTSSPFKVGGACRMTFSLGGAHDPRFCYVSLLDENLNEVARYGNVLFRDAGLGLINKGSNLANMVSYTVDLSEWRDRTLRIRITDNADSNWGLVTADSFITYYEENETARFPANSIEALNLLNRANPTASEFQIENGSFENDNLDGWELNGNIGNISYDYIWWNEWYTFNKNGLFFFSGFAGSEGDKGTLTSSTFTLGGSGIITYRLGGGMNPELCYIDVIDADDPELIYCRFANEKFSTRGGVFTGVPITVGCDGFGAKMVLYKADLSKFVNKGTKLRLRITDNASSDWGLIFADDFVTYYENANDVPKDAVSATDILPAPSFEDIERTLNLAFNINSVALNPVNHISIYSYTFALADEYEGVTLQGNVVSLTPQEELNANFDKTYEIIVKAVIKNTVNEKETEQNVKLTLTAIYDNRRLLNGDFETGDLTGWTVASGNVKVNEAVVSEETWWNEKLPYNQGGSYHFDGWSAQYAESDAYSLRSSNFTLDGSGFISFKMGGKAAALKVYKANGEQIALYKNTEFADVSYPHIDEGSRLATMTTFVADLHEYIGEELYIEICDEICEGWAVAFFDDIVTYYEVAPDTNNLSDTLKLNSVTSSTEEDCEYELKWVTAENKI